MVCEGTATVLLSTELCFSDEDRMKPLYRRLLLAGLYVASLAIVACIALFVGRNFTGAGPIPMRSAFAGRLPGSPDGDRRRFQFFYATNRDAKDDATFQGQGNRLGSEISTGTFDVRISPYMPITPRVWLDQNYMSGRTVSHSHRKAGWHACARTCRRRRTNRSW